MSILMTRDVYEPEVMVTELDIPAWLRAAEPPRKDDGELYLSKAFLDACVEDYAVFFTGPDSGSGKVFTAKHLNVVDPLRASNNLGRSVNQCRCSHNLLSFSSLP